MTSVVKGRSRWTDCGGADYRFIPHRDGPTVSPKRAKEDRARGLHVTFLGARGIHRQEGRPSNCTNKRVKVDISDVTGLVEVDEEGVEGGRATGAEGSIAEIRRNGSHIDDLARKDWLSERIRHPRKMTRQIRDLGK